MVIAILVEDYTEEAQAIAHVRRLLDIVACTSRFAKARRALTSPHSKARKSSKAQNNQKNNPSPPTTPNGETRVGSPAGVSPISDNLGMVAIHPTPKLSDFYEFFSFSHLTPPILREYSFSFFWLKYILVV